MRSELLKELSRNMVAEPTDYMTSFRKNLKTFIDHKEISIEKVAEAAGISVETLKTVLYGKAGDCKLSTVVALAKALELSIDELVGAGTISPIVCESLQITRNLPETYVYFIRWAIRYHERQLKNEHITNKAINVMTLDCNNDGVLSMSNNFDLVDISNISEEVWYRVFMGLRIPCDHYMPVLTEGDILLLANDRNPLQNEMVVVVTNNYARIVKRKVEINSEGDKCARYYSIRNGKLVADECSVDEVIGYVAKIIRNAE